MKSVLISIQPKWCELIAAGKKTIEVRKTAPKLRTPFKCYIYCTQGDGSLNDTLMSNDRCRVLNGKVIGEFVCDFVDETYPIHIPGANQTIYTDEWVKGSSAKNACLSIEEISEYGKGMPLYGWHISNLKIYDKPKELGEFRRNGEYCDDCKYLDKDIKVCKKYGEYLVHSELLDWNYRCEKCLDENCKITRPPQSWCYVEA